MDDISDIRDMYDAQWDREDGRLERHQLEHDITWRYLDAYLPPPGGRILEVGAATGRYTLELAQRGYHVLAIDLAPELVARARDRVSQAGFSDRVEFRVGDARDLAGVPQSAFDAALVMGPLYHLVDQGDRESALRETFSCLCRGARIFSSFISRYGIWGDVMKKIPETIENQADVRSVLDQGSDREREHPGEFRGYFAVTSEIPTLHEEMGFKTLVLAGVEPCISTDDETYNNLQGTRRRLWLDLLHELSAEPSVVAASRHLLYIGEKPE